MSMQARTLTIDSLEELEADRFLVNEIFFSIQGEGRLVGTPMVFLRFAECNLRCTVINAGFNCDTEFSSSRKMTLSEILQCIAELNPQKGWVLLTGGEPGLQVTETLIDALHQNGWRVAIETNGTVALPKGLDWICVSPKSAEHTIKQRRANEVKYVRSAGLGLPQSVVEAEHYLISPAFEADGSIKKETLSWCIDLVKQAPGKWSLSIQMHKLIGVR